MVLSLVIVPARAGENPPAAATASTGTVTITVDKTSVVEGQTVTYTITSAQITDSNGTAHDATVTSATWTPAGTKNENTITVTAPATTYTLGVSDITLTASDDSKLTLSDKEKITITAPQVTVTSKSDTLRNAITSITYNGRPVTISNDRKSVTYYSLTNDPSSEGWKASAPGFTEVSAKLDNTTLTVKGKNSDSQEISTTFTANSVEASVTLGTPTYPTISKDGTTSITATVKGFTPVQYTWAYTKDSDATVHAIPNQTTSTLTWTPGTAGTYKVTCTATYKQPSSAEANDGVSVTSPETTITVENKTYDIRSTSSPATAALSTVYASSNSAASFPAINLYDVTTPAAPVPVSPAVTFTYEEISDPSNAVRVDTQTGAITVTGSGTATLRAKTSYKGKTYLKDLTVYASALMADFDRQAWYNSPATYYYSDLVTAATKALSTGNTYGSNYYYGTVNTIQTVSVNNNSLGTSTNTLSYGAQSGSITFTPYYNARSKAPVTVTLTTTTG